MPIRDRERNREYQRLWQKKKLQKRKEDPEAYEAFLRRQRKVNKQYRENVKKQTQELREKHLADLERLKDVNRKETKMVHKELKVSTLVEGENKTRANAQANLGELMSDLKVRGMINPISVREVKSGRTKKFEIVAGHRRFNAAKKLGWKTVPVHVHKLDDIEAKTMNVAENWHRTDVSFGEVATAILDLKSHGFSNTEAAAKLGMQPQTVSRIINAQSRLPEKFIDDIVFNRKGRGKVPKGKISYAAANKVLTTTGKERLTIAQQAKVFEALKDGADTKAIPAMMKAARAGRSVTKAMSHEDKFVGINVNFSVNRKKRKKFEEEFEVRFTDFCRNILLNHRDIKPLLK